MRWVRRLLFFGLLAATFYGGWKFTTENAHEVNVSYIVGQTPAIALWQVVLAAFAAGVVLTAVVGFYTNTRLRLVTRRYRKTVKGLESEVHQLRNLPLSDGAPPTEGAAAPGSAEALPEGALERGA